MGTLQLRPVEHETEAVSQRYFKTTGRAPQGLPLHEGQSWMQFVFYVQAILNPVFKMLILSLAVCAS